MLEKYMGKVPLAKMSLKQAKEFLQKVKNMPATSDIGKFLIGVQQEADEALERLKS